MANSCISAQNVIQNCKPGYVALTFDDGPNIHTPHMLDILKREGVPVTFFVNGKNFLSLDDTEAQGILKSAYNDGHQIASHTWSHKDLTTLRGREFDSEVTSLENAINSAIGVKPAFIRPPYGSTDDRVERRLANMGYTVALWSTDTFDYVSHNLAEEMKNIEDSYKDGVTGEGPIVLSHDVHYQTAYELAEEMIKTFRSKGFQFATVAQCADSPAYK
ncbi:hypothetical protein BD560DRAFT_335249 [Blakeslea trispora]|nr:hypothetical protein BD560DRAFT_335249 [Blakeslea trispora]